MLKINGAALNTPSKFGVSFEERGDFSKYNVLGERLADRLAVKRVIEAEWPMLTAAEAAALFGAGAAGVFFTVTYPDPQTGADRAAVCRATEKSARVQRMNDGAAVWTDVRIRWEER